MIIQAVQIMGTKVITVTMQAATTKWAMYGMIIGYLAAKQNAQTAVSKKMLYLVIIRYIASSKYSLCMPLKFHISLCGYVLLE